MATIGELHQTPKEFNFEWRIENASSFLDKGDFEYYSVPFYFSDAIWKIKMFCGAKEDNVSFELKRMSLGSPVKLKYSAAIKNCKGEEKFLKCYDWSFKENSCHVWKELSKSEIRKHRSHYLPSDTLTLIYKLESTEKYDITSFPLANLLDLADSFKKLFAEKRGADLKFKQKGKDFLVHRMMLEARSTICEKKLSEKEKEELNIDDIDPSSIGAVLEYIYTGDTNKLTKENVLFAYAAANNYEMGQLKKICTAYIKPNLTVEWVCEVYKFAVKLKAEDIVQYTTRYFIENSAKITDTNEWDTFFDDNHDIAVKLLLAKAKDN